MPESRHAGACQVEDLAHLVGDRVRQPGDVQRCLQRQPGGLRIDGWRLEALVDEEICSHGCVHHVTARAGVTREDDLETAVGDGVADCSAETVDGREAGDGHPVALVDRLRSIERDLVADHREACGGTHSTHRGRVPGHRLAHVVDERRQAQVGILVGSAPDLDGVHPPSLRQAPHETGDVADVVSVEVGQEHLGRGLDRQREGVEVGQRSGPEVEEEEVPLRVAHLDQHRSGCLTAPDPRVSASEHGDADLAGGQHLGAGNEDLRSLVAGSSNHGSGGQRPGSAQMSEYRHRRCGHESPP